MTNRRDFLRFFGLAAAAVPLAPLLPTAHANGPAESPSIPLPPTTVGYAQVNDGLCTSNGVLTASHYGPGFSWVGDNDHGFYVEHQGPWPR